MFAVSVLSLGIVFVPALRARGAVPTPTPSPLSEGSAYFASFTNETSRENVVSASERWPGGTLPLEGSGIPIPGQGFPRGIEESILLVAHRDASITATLSNGVRVTYFLNDPRLCDSHGCGYSISYKGGFRIMALPLSDTAAITEAALDAH
jgi:hypothetical protein